MISSLSEAIRLCYTHLKSRGKHKVGRKFQLQRNIKASTEFIQLVMLTKFRLFQVLYFRGV